MPRYEYKVVPAPVKGRKAKGIKTPEGRFALSVEDVLNEMGAEGWEYLRAELLPSEERSGLTGSTRNWRNVLVFRRAQDSDAVAQAPDHVPPSAAAASVMAAGALAAQTHAAAPSDHTPRIGPATRPEAPPAPAPEPESASEPDPDSAPAEMPPEQPDQDADLDRLFDPEPDEEETVMFRPNRAKDTPEPAEPERRTPPDLSTLDAAPEAAPADPAVEETETPARERHWDEDENTAPLSGIERVVRRNAAQQRDNSDES